MSGSDHTGWLPEDQESRLASRLSADQLEMVAAELGSGPDPEGAADRLISILETDLPGRLDDELLQRLSSIAASSRALSRTLAQHPALVDGPVPEASTVTLHLRSALAGIAGADLAGQVDLVEATARFSEAIDGIVSSSLQAARRSIAGQHPVVDRLPFVVVAMGKWGAMELNYASDVDLVFVHDNLTGEEAACREAALALASRLISDLSSPTFDGPALVVDADLRPEGTMGPLSRSLDGFARYYEEWGEAWELQALLKARPVAGDAELGQRFMKLAEMVVWDRGLDVEALRSIRRIKEQAESSAPSLDIKRAPGGIRDIEFSVQLLQLVHGRLDPEIREPSTLAALSALAANGYIEEAEREQFANDYRFLRNLEHRIQLWDLRQTHSIPQDDEARLRVARSMGLASGEELMGRLSEVRADVRHLHETLYFRPILESLVGSPSARLGLAQAELRLEALGFRDAVGARLALRELTTGLSRRSRLMYQMLPLMLDWLSLAPDPDLGLAQLRNLLAHSSDHSHLITILQRSPAAGERLCMLLGTGRLLGDLLDRIPEYLPRLTDETRIADIRDAADAELRLIELLDSRPDPETKIGTIRRFTRRRKLRIAARDVLGEAPVVATLESLSSSADAAIAGALHIAAGGPAQGFAVIAMGKWGGRELSYGSDLDLMYVFDDEAERGAALELTSRLARILSEPSRHGDGYSLDAEIRPEGAKGPMARSLASYQRYYQQWAEAWEDLALIKARPVAGDPALGSRFMQLAGDHLWAEPVKPTTARDIRLIKARVESERIPAHEDPDYHLKLGPGGLSDVEFLVQLLQLEHGPGHSTARAANTLEALRGLRSIAVLDDTETDALSSSYVFCTRIRTRLHLQAGRAQDALPSDGGELIKLATSLGIDRASDLREQYRRLTRRARQVFEARFYL